jgi:NAD(P)-dependent dehydrogenase (short-subunit alcohol dehydrogenase family)
VNDVPGSGQAPGAGPVAVVTGASEGIGLAVAARLAADGYRVAMAARPSPKLEAAATELGQRAFPVGCDVTKAAEVERAVAGVVRRCGRIDALVNCASVTRAGAVTSFTDEEWAEAFQVKVFGALRMMRAAWPHLASARGAVVNIGGIGARTPRDAFAMTGPLSAALLAFTKVFADRGITEGVRVNAVNPGAVLTPRIVAMLTARAEADGRTFGETVAGMVRRDHVTRLGTPEDVAGVVAFLLSPDGQWLQGAVIDVDGGRTKGLLQAGGNWTGGSCQRHAGWNQGNGRRSSSTRCRTPSPTRPTTTRRWPGRWPRAASSRRSAPWRRRSVKLARR